MYMETFIEAALATNLVVSVYHLSYIMADAIDTYNRYYKPLRKKGK